MAQIALISCIAFSIFLFVLDKKKKADTSWALWVPLLFFLISASRPIALWLNPNAAFELPEDASDGSPADRYFFIFLIISGTFILLKRRLNWSHIARNNVWVFLLFLYCGISILWSDAPRASIYAWIKVMVLPIMALIIITEQNPLESLKTVVKRTACVLIPLSIILIKYYPVYGRSYSPFTGAIFYGGVTTFKNGLGVLCMITGLFLAWDLINMLRDKTVRFNKTPLLINIALIGMIIYLLSIANSATAVVGSLLGVCILIGLELPIIKANVKNFNIIVYGLIFLAFVSFLSFNLFEGVLSSLGRDTTLTGRTIIWERVLGMGSNPIIGTGYSSFWQGLTEEFLLELCWQRLSQAHNGYIEVYLNLGLIGLGLLIMMIIGTYKNSKKALLTDFQYGKLRFMYLVVFVFTNITEASFTIKSTSWFMLVLIALQYSQRKKVKK